MIPWQPPPPDEAQRIRKALERHRQGRNERDEQQQHRAAERVLERLLDREGE